jgi:hypothetical protein
MNRMFRKMHMKASHQELEKRKKERKKERKTERKGDEEGLLKAGVSINGFCALWFDLVIETLATGDQFFFSSDSFRISLVLILYWLSLCCRFNCLLMCPVSLVLLWLLIYAAFKIGPSNFLTYLFILFVLLFFVSSILVEKVTNFSVF